MKDKMNVLFIAPFENMRAPILKVSESYPDIELTVMVGNQETGRRIAQEAFAANYDCIISRGNTARMIRQAVSIPVVEVKVTLYDILGSFSDAAQIPEIVAAVGYHNVVSGMEALKRFLPFRLETFGFDSLDELDGILESLNSRNIRTIVCDTITHQLSTAKGFDAHIIHSGEDAYRYAFDQVMLLLQSSKSMLEENGLLRRLSSVNSESETVVYAQNKTLYYSSLTEQNAFLLEYLEERLSDFETHDKFRIIKRQSGYQYRISARKVTVSSRIYYAYFISRRIPDIQGGRRCIRFLTETDIHKEMDGSVFRIANLENYYSSELNRALSLRNPVLIFGDIGVGKNHLAEMIYLNSDYIKNPFILIDFSLVNKQELQRLITKNDSPLCDNGNTLFLKNIDALSMEQLNLLLAALEESEAAKRNRLLISCSYRHGSLTSTHLQKTMYQLSCISIQMMPLQGQYGAIENSISFLLGYFRDVEGLTVSGIEPEALSSLLYFEWPQNYLQLIRVMRKLAILAGSGTITKRIVSDALTTELYLTQGETPQTANTMLDLSKPLEEINADIVKILLDQNGGNQTLTAKNLGISRTTMWRILKSQA